MLSFLKSFIHKVTFLYYFFALSIFSCHVYASDILVLHSAFQGDVQTREIQQGIESKFTETDISLFVTYLDSHHQVMSDSVLTEYASLLSKKFAERHFDAVIVSGENALRLMKYYSLQLFQQTPIIFVGVPMEGKPLTKFTHQISGVVEPDSLFRTIQLSVELFPNTNDIYVVTGDSLSSQLSNKKIQRLSRQLKQRVIVLSNETTLSLKEIVSKVSINSVLIFDDFSRDKNGDFVNRGTVLKSLSSVARMPLFVVHEHDLIEGVIGGVVTSGVNQGSIAADKVLHLLDGASIDSFPIKKNVRNKYLVQYTELLRWGLKENDLPIGYAVINKPEQYNTSSFSLSTLILTVFGFIILLIWVTHRYYKLQQAQSKLLVNHERADNIFNVSYDFIFILDLVGEIKKVNQTALDFIDMTEKQVKGSILWDTPWWQYDAASKKKLKSAMGQARVGKTARFECHLIDKNKNEHDFDVFIQSVKNTEKTGRHFNEINSIIVEARDISGIKAIEEEVQKANKRSHLLLDESPSMLLMLNAQGLILSCNKFGCNLLGYKDGELIGRNLVTLYSQLFKLNELKEYLELCIENEGMLQTREISYSTKSGRKVWINERVRKIEGHDQYFLVCENITERYELSKELNYRASHDYLTGLKNRLFFESQLELSLKELEGASGSCCLMYLDMDKFKIINDTCGHHAGDEVLKQIATILIENVPSFAIVARLGGDEFSIILTQTALKEAEKFAEAIISAIGKHYFLWEGHSFSLGVSIGLSEVTDFRRGGVYALNCVDSACYIAKESGRNRIHIYEEDKQEALRRQEVMWVNKVQDALRDESRFCLYAQLIKPVNGDENYLHYEILTRMIDENGMLASPDKFIPVAESYNLADKIDMIIITKTLNWLKNHPEHVLKLNMCSINLSGQSIGDPRFIENLVSLLTHSSLPLEKLCFEITETVAIGNFSNASKLIRSLKKLGCQLALDDFGTGLSSFGYLKRLDVDYLKIDGVFVKDMATNDQDYGIVKTIHELSHLFGKKTIAEYVENEDIIDKLNEIGVDYAQGYHLGKPTPIDMMALLSDSLFEENY